MKVKGAKSHSMSDIICFAPYLVLPLAALSCVPLPWFLCFVVDVLRGLPFPAVTIYLWVGLRGLVYWLALAPWKYVGSYLFVNFLGKSCPEWIRHV